MVQRYRQHHHFHEHLLANIFVNTTFFHLSNISNGILNDLDFTKNTQNVAIENRFKLHPKFGSIWINPHKNIFVILLVGISWKIRLHGMFSPNEMNMIWKQWNPCSCFLCDENMQRMFHLTGELAVLEIGTNAFTSH